MNDKNYNSYKDKITNQEPFRAQQRKVELMSQKNDAASSTKQTILHMKCTPSLQHKSCNV